MVKKLVGIALLSGALLAAGCTRPMKEIPDGFCDDPKYEELAVLDGPGAATEQQKIDSAADEALTTIEDLFENGGRLPVEYIFGFMKTYGMVFDWLPDWIFYEEHTEIAVEREGLKTPWGERVLAAQCGRNKYYNSRGNTPPLECVVVPLRKIDGYNVYDVELEALPEPALYRIGFIQTDTRTILRGKAAVGGLDRTGPYLTVPFEYSFAHDGQDCKVSFSEEEKLVCDHSCEDRILQFHDRMEKLYEGLE